MNINIVEYPFSCQASTAIQPFPRQVVLPEAKSWNIPPWIFSSVCSMCTMQKANPESFSQKAFIIKSREGAIQPSRNGWSGLGWQNWPSTQMHKHGSASIWPSNRLWFRTQPIVRLIQNQEAEYDFGCNWLSDWSQNRKEFSTIRTKCAILESKNVIISLE